MSNRAPGSSAALWQNRSPGCQPPARAGTCTSPSAEPAKIKVGWPPLIHKDSNFSTEGYQVGQVWFTLGEPALAAPNLLFLFHLPRKGLRGTSSPLIQICAHSPWASHSSHRILSFTWRANSPLPCLTSPRTLVAPTTKTHELPSPPDLFPWHHRSASTGRLHWEEESSTNPTPRKGQEYISCSLHFLPSC